MCAPFGRVMRKSEERRGRRFKITQNKDTSRRDQEKENARPIRVYMYSYCVLVIRRTRQKKRDEK